MANCPNCSAALPISLAFVGRGRVHKCASCGSRYKVRRASAFTAIALMSFLMIIGTSLDGWLRLACLAATVVVMFTLEYLFLKAQLVRD